PLFRSKKWIPAWTNSVEPRRGAPWLRPIGSPPGRDLVGRPRLAKRLGAGLATSGPGYIRWLREPLCLANRLRRWYHLQREMGRGPRECVDYQGGRRVGPRIGCQCDSSPDDRPIRSGLQGRQVASGIDAGRRLWVEAGTGPVDAVRAM